VTVGSLPYAPARPAPPPAERLPALLQPTPIDPETALGRLFAASWRDQSLERCTALLGPWAPALALLPERERRRAALVAAWFEALWSTAREGDRAERRLERVNRSAYLVARALAGEPGGAPFALCFAGESAARAFPRRALDLLLAETRALVLAPRDADLAAWNARARALGGALAEAIFGREPSPATVDAAAALLRLALLARLPVALAAGRSHLPGPAPADVAETVAAIAGEAAEVRAQLLRGARALAEVPLGHRRALEFLSASALDLVGRIEVNPAELLERSPHVGWWRRRLMVWRARRTPL